MLDDASKALNRAIEAHVATTGAALVSIDHVGRCGAMFAIATSRQRIEVDVALYFRDDAESPWRSGPTPSPTSASQDTRPRPANYCASPAAPRTPATRPE